MKQLGILIALTLLSGVLVSPISPLSAFAAGSTSTVVTSSHNPSIFGQSVNFTSAVSPSNATGIVIFNDTSTNPPTILDAAVISGGLASFSVSSLSVGNHTIVATYVGDANYSSSTSGVLVQVVDKIGTTTSVSSSTNPSSFGQPVNFTATVSQVSGTLAPAGTVQFLVDGSAVGSPVTLAGGKAAFAASLSAGSHVIRAEYSGNAVFAASNGSVTQAVSQTGTSVSLASSQNPSAPGQSITLTANVSPSNATGTVQFNDTSVTPSAVLGTSTLSGGSAALSISSLSAGSHVIVAKYSGDADNAPSTSNVITQIVNSTSASSLILDSNSTSLVFGQSVTFTALVSPPNATGTVQFQVNGTNMGSPVVLSGGVAALDTSSLPVGTGIVSASYSGDGNFDSSISNSVTIVVASASQSAPAVGKISGNGHLEKGVGFEFKIDSKNGTNLKGHLHYHDKASHFDLHSKVITSVSVDNVTGIVITGQAKAKDGTHGNRTESQVTFVASMTVSDKKGKLDQFSIVVTDNAGNVIYQKSGAAKGHIKIHEPKEKHDEHEKQHPKEKDEDQKGPKKDDKHGNLNMTSGKPHPGEKHEGQDQSEESD